MSGLPGKRQAYEPNRSCERCRSLKIRCHASDSSSSSTCPRCARLNVECVYALPAKRKPRKRTDAKVAELEKEVRALSSILRKQHESSASSSSPISVISETQTPEINNINSAAQCTYLIDHSKRNPTLDVIESGLVSYELASKIFNVFAAKFIPRFPVVALTANATIDSIKDSRPMLLLAILATASVIVDPELSQKIHDKLAAVLAMQSMVSGPSSLDLLQALLVTTVWYFPGQSFDELKYQQYSHMVAGVALQIGIERKGRLGVRRDATTQGELSENPSALVDEIEVQRTLLSCYLLCSGISRSLHRPTIFPFTRFMYGCLDALETSPFAAVTDKTLALWIRLQRIITESSTALGADDSAQTVDVSEPMIQHTLQTCSAQLDTWYSKFNQESDDILLRFDFYVNKVYLHEVAMYSDHDPDDFKPPFTLDRVSKPVNRKFAWTPTHVHFLSICWTNTCTSLDIFLKMSAELLRTAPDKIFIRVIYCVVVLLKITLSANSQSCIPASHVPFAQEPQYGRVISYVDRLAPLLKTTAEGGLCPIAGKLELVLQHIKSWIARQGANLKAGNSGDSLLEPLRDLSLDTKPKISVTGLNLAFDDRNSKNMETSNEKDLPEIRDDTNIINPIGQQPTFYQLEKYHFQSEFQLDGGPDAILEFESSPGFNLQSLPEDYSALDFDFQMQANAFDIFEWVDR